MAARLVEQFTLFVLGRMVNILLFLVNFYIFLKIFSLQRILLCIFKNSATYVCVLGRHLVFHSRAVLYKSAVAVFTINFVVIAAAISIFAAIVLVANAPAGTSRIALM